MPRDVWSEDRAQRTMVLQERSDAVANDRTPAIAALEPMPADDAPTFVLLRRVSDGWLEAKLPDEAVDLIASGEFRPFTATEGMTDSGTLCCQADPEWVAFRRKERITALLTQQAREELEVMAAQIAAMRVEELDALESSLMLADSLGDQP
jgi:hypothetical protein